MREQSRMLAARKECDTHTAVMKAGNGQQCTKFSSAAKESGVFVKPRR
jgi:hypothetical protein